MTGWCGRGGAGFDPWREPAGIWWDDDKNHHQLTSGVPPLVDGPFGYSFEGGSTLSTARRTRFLVAVCVLLTGASSGG